MTPKPQIFKDIDTIRNKHDLIFRAALGSLFENGYNYYSEENTRKLIQKQVEEAKEDQKKGRIMFVTREFNIAIIETAHELSHYSLWDLLKYVKRYVKIS